MLKVYQKLLKRKMYQTIFKRVIITYKEKIMKLIT